MDLGHDCGVHIVDTAMDHIDAVSDAVGIQFAFSMRRGDASGEVVFLGGLRFQEKRIKALRCSNGVLSKIETLIRDGPSLASASGTG
jgi:hypothetical protein